MFVWITFHDAGSEARYVCMRLLLNQSTESNYFVCLLINKGGEYLTCLYNASTMSVHLSNNLNREIEEN